MRNAATVPPHLCAIDATGASWLTSIGMPPLTIGSRSGSSDGPAHIILVVENDVLIRMPLAEYLRECGYRVFEAADVAEAKAVLNADTPVDLVFADANVARRRERLHAGELGCGLTGHRRSRSR